MPIVDDSYADAILDALAGPGLAAGLPDTMWVALYDSDPRDGGEEVTGGGYSRLGPIDMTSATMWPAASARQKASGEQVGSDVLTDVFDLEATWAAMVDTEFGAPAVVGFAQQLPQPIPGGDGQLPVMAAGDLIIPLSDIGSD